MDPSHLVELAGRRIELEAAFVEGRFLAGDEALWEDVRAAVLSRARDDPEAYRARIRTATELRRSEAEDATAALEPHLRDGRGGLVDLATIGWLEAVLGTQDVDRSKLDSAAEVLHRVRTALHHRAGHGTDVLGLAQRDGVAVALFGSDAGQAAEISLMRTLYEHARTVAAALDAVLDPERREPAAAARFREALGDDPARSWPLEARAAFVDLLAGSDAHAALASLDACGLLSRAIPEWTAIRCLPERRTYHRWAVDEHCFRAVVAVRALASDPDDAVRAAAEASAADTEVLLLATLLHDVGKGGETDHSERGAELARAAVGRMGLGDADAADVAWLVRHHLLLSHMATRRDIGDESLVLEVAGRIGTERRLRLLWLLTIADGRATGPAAWSLWKATLTSRLHNRLLDILRRGDAAADDTAARIHDAMERVRSALADLPRGPVEQHLELMPAAWLLSQPHRALVEHSRHMIDFHTGEEVRIHATALPGTTLWELVVVASDRPGLFSRISGVLALHDLNVLGAEAFTRQDGVALELFRLEALSEEPRRFERVAEDARKALRGRISLALRLAERRSDPATGSPAAPPPRIVVDNEASERFSIVEVHARDRIGLLFTITRALAELELDIQLAKVSTYGEEVVDVFYVCDRTGAKATDAGYVSEIQAAVAFAVSGRAIPTRDERPA
jgi:[protein-PII] uridylyltransferase